VKREFSLNHINEKMLAEEKILDVPCGSGEFCMLFPATSYYGLDISEKYIDYARQKNKRRFICADAAQTDFDDDYFDKILTVGFLHHLDEITLRAVLKESRRILKPDGMMLLMEDAPTSIPWNFVGKICQKLDMGSNIRPGSAYRVILEKEFDIRRYYHLRSGFWDYSVFVLSRK